MPCLAGSFALGEDTLLISCEREHRKREWDGNIDTHLAHLNIFWNQDAAESDRVKIAAPFPYSLSFRSLTASSRVSTDRQTSTSPNLFSLQHFIFVLTFVNTLGATCLWKYTENR